MKQFFTLLCCLISIAGVSQVPSVIYSEPFEEPDAIRSKVFQCINGNTILFSFKEKELIETDVYDQSHKVISHGKITCIPEEQGNVKDLLIVGIYNIDSSIAMFVQAVVDRKPQLYRLIISPATGRIVKRERIAQMDSYSRYGSFGGSVSRTRLPKEFFVEKDQNSDAYAVAFLDMTELTLSTKHIEVIHFDGKHSRVGGSVYDDPDGNIASKKYGGMVVRGNDEVILFTHSPADKRDVNKGVNQVISILKANRFEHTRLNTLLERNILHYNSHTGNLEFLSLGPSEQKGNTIRYAPKLVAINPVDNATVYETGLDVELATAHRQSYYKNLKAPYSGIPMDMIINPDGTKTIVMEEMESSSDGVQSLADIGIVDYDKTGRPTHGYTIHKQHLSRSYNAPLSHDDLRKSRVELDRKYEPIGNTHPGFYSCRYFSTPGGRIVIFNDHPENFDKRPEETHFMLQGVSKSNTVCYRLNQGEMSKFYLFGAPGEDFDNRFADISSGSYSYKTGEYAVLMMERSARKKQARIAWVQLK